MPDSKDLTAKDITFSALPRTYEEFIALPQADLKDPFGAAALTVMAFAIYPENKDMSLKMIQYLRGPRELSTYDKQFIRDRFMESDYVPRSYFSGTSPANNYGVAAPYTITVFTTPYSYQEEGYANLYMNSSGADSPRSVKMRLAKDGKWYLWEQYILVGIRQPESSNPWA